MPMQPPTYRDLSRWNSNVSQSVWEIHTPKKNSLYWSIIVAYLLPTVYSKKSDALVKSLKQSQPAKDQEKSLKRNELKTESNISFWEGILIILVYSITTSFLIFMYNRERYTRFTKRLINLTGDDNGTKSAMNKMRSFNPFKNIHEFPFESSMMDIFKKFKELVNAKSKNEPTGSAVDMKLAAASKMLNCNIELYLTNSTGIKERKIYPPGAQSTSSSAGPDTIIIFQHESTKMEEGMFGFGMELEIAQRLQKRALASILRKDKFLKENNAKIMRAISDSDNFLISLLKSDIKNVIARIYKSPYILMKLRDAGYNMNPLVKGSDDFSAFYSCISLPDSQYFHMLYNYASNYFCHSDGSFRIRVDETIQALRNLRQSIETDFKHSNEFASLPSIAKDRYWQILRFNEYQMAIMEKIKENLQGSKKGIVLEISDILNIYSKYFLYDTPSDNEQDQFENYRKFSDYYENLDSYTCMLLFDRFISGQNKIYSSLVEPLFLMMMSNNYFPHKEHAHNGGSLTNCKKCSQRCIPFKYRQNFSEVLKTVKNSIPNSPAGKISAGEIVHDRTQFIPKDEFLLSRLKTSLDVAINAEVDDVEGRLTIFNTLQVFGEVLAAAETENFPGGFLLSAQIPDDIEEALCGIRNDISHYKGNVAQGRLRLENRTKLVQKIKAELRLLYHVLEPIFAYRQFKMKEFVMERAREKFKISIDDFRNIAAGRENWYKENWDQFKSVAENILGLFQRVLWKKFPKKDLEKIRIYEKKCSKKIKRLKNGVDALDFVFSFKTASNDPNATEIQTKASEELEKLRNLIEPLKNQEPSADEIEKMKEAFETFVSLLASMFNIDVKNKNVNVRCPNLIYLHKTLKNYNVFGKTRNSKIRTFILNFLEPSFEATLNLEKALKNPRQVQNVNNLIHQIFLTEKMRKIFKKHFSSSKNLKRAEKKAFKRCYKSKETALGEENQTTEMILKMCKNEEYRRALLKQFSSIEDNSAYKSFRNFFPKLVNTKMEFFINRINLIKKILRSEMNDIDGLAKFNRSGEIEEHIKILLCHRFVRVPKMKSSLEMLLFDCMNVIKNNTGLKDIRIKMDNMFAGADLRNVFSHGNILVGSLGTLLDPNDLPQETINKMLVLVKDLPVLETLSNFWKKHPIIWKEDTIPHPLSFKDLKTSMEANKNSKTVEKIKECPRWQSYAQLLKISSRGIN